MFSTTTRVNIFFLIFLSVSALMLYYKLYEKLNRNETPSKVSMKIHSEAIGLMNTPIPHCMCNRTINITWSQDELSRKQNLKSNCGQYSTLKGLGQKVVSFSLYGKFPGDYHRGLEQLVPLVEKFYPGWNIRVYHDGYLWQMYDEQEWACSLLCNYTQVDFCDTVAIPDLGNVNTTWGSLWRFIVVGDPTVERYIVRDLDSPILQREVDAVTEWIESGKCYHVMRDNQHHGVPMMAGMWGGCNTWEQSSSTAPKELRAKMLQYGTSLNMDQPALWDFIWPQVQANGIQHDSYTCMKFPGSLPFPTKREGNTYVGMRTFKDGYEYDAIRRTCPDICRPPDHMDWVDC